MRFRSLFFSLLLLMGIACQTAAPTPLLIGRLIDLNNEVVELYVDCSEGANYVKTKPGCDSQLLSTKTDTAMTLSVDFISADIKQSQGYDVYLATAMIYFRISQRNQNDYTRAEQIARQFFEVQKAHSGRSADEARFYWTWFSAATAAKQFFEDPPSLTAEQKSNLELALKEGSSLIGKLEGGRLVRLNQALASLRFIIDSIE